MIKSGLWKSSTQNPFWINVIENKVFWLGMNKKSDQHKIGENWCHVGYGILNGDKINLEWSDIAAGTDKLNGAIVIQILSSTEMKVIEDSGDFGMSVWNWESEVAPISSI